MPWEKVLAWQCPVASAIRQGRLISQSEIQGGNADKLNEHQVPGPQGVQEPHKSLGQQVGVGAVEGQTGVLQEPFTCLPLQPLFQGLLFSGNIKEALPRARHCAVISQTLIPLKRKTGGLTDSWCPKLQGFAGCAEHTAVLDVNSLATDAGGQRESFDSRMSMGILWHACKLCRNV